MIDRLKQMDADGDGKISLADEATEQTRQFMGQMDVNNDGFIDMDEIDGATERMSQMGGQRGGRMGGQGEGTETGQRGQRGQRPESGLGSN